MASNSSPCNGTQLNSSSQGPLVYTNSLSTSSASSNCTTHKSFDFSNINVNSNPYKQYHQTRIYIKDFQGMTTGGSQIGGENSTYIISGNLPDSFNYAIGSQWGNPLSDIFQGVGNLVLQMASAAAMQAGGGWADVGQHFRSGINRAANFLIWSGAKPLEIQLKIPVIDDNDYQSSCGNVRTNLKEALEFLGCLCLPKLDGELGFYTPAPSPLELTIIAGKHENEAGEKVDNSFTMSPNKARIMVQIGGMLFIDNCIIKGVSVNYPNTKALMLRNDGTLSPVLAEVTINITTIETLTSTTFTKMLWLQQQENQGKGEANLNKLYDKGKELLTGVGTTAGNYVKNGINTLVDKVGGITGSTETLQTTQSFQTDSAQVTPVNQYTGTAIG